MFKLSFLIATMVLSHSTIAGYAQTDTSRSWFMYLQPFAGAGLQRFHYHIAGNEQGLNPNILSELIWRNNLTSELGASLEVKWQRLNFRSGYSISHNQSGTVSDIDYAEDNRQSVFSDRTFSNHKGKGHQLSISAGYDLPVRKNLILNLFLTCQFQKNTLYLLNQKHLRQQDENYLPSLNSYYRYHLPGFGGGMLIDYHCRRLIEFNIEARLQRIVYSATGSWNLREDFAQPDSYLHRGRGIQIAVIPQIRLLISRHSKIGLSYSYSSLNVSNGRDRLLLADGIEQLTRLNEVAGRKSALHLTMNFSIL